MPTCGCGGTYNFVYVAGIAPSPGAPKQILSDGYVGAQCPACNLALMLSFRASSNRWHSAPHESPIISCTHNPYE